MSDQPQSIKDFCTRIEEDAEKEIAGILERAEYTAKGRTAQILQDTEEKKKAILEKGAEEAKTARRLVLSDLNLELKKVGLRIKGEIVEETLSLLRRKIEQFRSSSDYPAFLANLALEGIKALGQNEIVITSGDLDGNLLTQDVLDDIRKRGKTLLREDIRISVSSETLKNSSGLRLSTKDGRLFYDNTLESRIERMSDDLRLIISRKIFG
jgi:vacuolar-type H+-ATPase subunit E/Vma4